MADRLKREQRRKKLLELEEKQERLFSGTKGRLLSLVLEIVIVLFLAYGAAGMFFNSVEVPDNTMEPTLSSGQIMLVNRAGYLFSAPQRGEIIAFRVRDDEEADISVKRIVGLPGETIQIRDGQILVNDITYVEGKNLPLITSGGRAEEPVTLGEGEYFVLGDNRNGSIDSRNAEIANVKKSQIVGKLWMTVSPFRRFGLLKE